MRGVVALLTDFGTQDHYVGAVKGAILAAEPEARLVDLVHDLPPHDIAAAAYALDAAYRAFPAGSVFLAIVDPGVGTRRRALALAAGGYHFVGPDNGLFTLVLAEHADAVVHEITNAGLFRHAVSATFHGRDVLAPVAGRLAAGMPLSEVGAPIADPVVFPIEGPQAVGPGVWEGTVIHVDRFGNLVSAFSSLDVDGILTTAGGDPTELVVVVEGAVMPLVRSFSDVAEGEPCAYLGSSRRLEIAVNRGSASRVLGAGRGASVRVRRA
jgi:S-adenosylmethionine hydrolase